MINLNFVVPTITAEQLEAMEITSNGDGSGHKVFFQQVDGIDPDTGCRVRGSINLWGQSPGEQTAARGLKSNPQYANAAGKFSAAKYLADKVRQAKAKAGAAITRKV